jgi:hypothetical protein
MSVGSVPRAKSRSLLILQVMGCLAFIYLTFMTSKSMFSRTNRAKPIILLHNDITPIYTRRLINRVLSQEKDNLQEYDITVCYCYVRAKLSCDKADGWCNWYQTQARTFHFKHYYRKNLNTQFETTDYYC